MVGLGYFFIANGLLALGALWLWRSRERYEAKVLLRAGYVLGFAAFLMPALPVFIPSQDLPRPGLQFYADINSKQKDAWTVRMVVSERTAERVWGTWQVSKVRFQRFLEIFLWATFGIGLLLLSRALALRLSLLRLPVMRRIGKVTLLCAEGDSTPYSFWWGRAFVILPRSLISDAARLRMAVVHELEHHRSRDTQWVYALESIRHLFFWNPFSHLYFRVLTELQEISCDARVLRRRNVCAKDYALCMVQMAESAGRWRGWFGLAPNLVRSSPRDLLTRRIHQMANDKITNGSSAPLWSAVLTLLGIFLAGSLYSQGVLAKDRLTLSEGRELAAALNPASEIPITVNELVLERLNKYVGTYEGRKWLKAAMDRMPQYKKLIERKIEEYNLPPELMAVPLWESGFRNDVISPGYKARGIWQFVAATARRYKLVVNDERDERLDPEKETDAAMRYLRDLFSQFQDWRLALKAYNEGEVRVQRLIDEHGTRDPWELEKLDSKEGYLSGVTAMILLFRNPSLVE